MIHYHGGQITPITAAAKLWRGRHAMVSFWNPEQIDVAADECQSFALDNGAFSAWKLGNPVADWNQYYDWVKRWKNHPGFDFAIIPDVIDGSEADNDRLIHEWPLSNLIGVPVWHMHEPLSRLQDLIKAFQRVAIGSSGEYATIGNSKWWDRISEAMDMACTDEGVPRAKLHGLRMLNPRIFGEIPFSSADSTNIARNIKLDQKWKGTYVPASKEIRSLVLADRIEQQNSAPYWVKRYRQVRFN